MVESIRSAPFRSFIYLNFNSPLNRLVMVSITSDPAKDPARLPLWQCSASLPHDAKSQPDRKGAPKGGQATNMEQP